MGVLLASGGERSGVRNDGVPGETGEVLGETEGALGETEGALGETNEALGETDGEQVLNKTDFSVSLRAKESPCSCGDRLRVPPHVLPCALISNELLCCCSGLKLGRLSSTSLSHSDVGVTSMRVSLVVDLAERGDPKEGDCSLVKSILLLLS